MFYITCSPVASLNTSLRNQCENQIKNASSRDDLHIYCGLKRHTSTLIVVAQKHENIYSYNVEAIALVEAPS